jgi:hypothetical protein
MLHVKIFPKVGCILGGPIGLRIGMGLTRDDGLITSGLHRIYLIKHMDHVFYVPYVGGTNQATMHRFLQVLTFELCDEPPYIRLKQHDERK